MDEGGQRRPASALRGRRTQIRIAVRLLRAPIEQCEQPGRIEGRTVTDQALDIDRPVIVWGDSMFGALAMTYATTQPARGAVTVDDPFDVRFFARLVRQLEHALRSDAFAKTFQRVFQARMRLDLLEKAVRAQVLAGQRIRPDLVLGYWTELLDTDLEALQSRIDRPHTTIQAPVLAVFGHDISSSDRTRLNTIPTPTSRSGPASVTSCAWSTLTASHPRLMAFTAPRRHHCHGTHTRLTADPPLTTLTDPSRFGPGRLGTPMPGPLAATPAHVTARRCPSRPKNDLGQEWSHQIKNRDQGHVTKQRRRAPINSPAGSGRSTSCVISARRSAWARRGAPLPVDRCHCRAGAPVIRWWQVGALSRKCTGSSGGPDHG